MISEKNANKGICEGISGNYPMNYWTEFNLYI